MQSSLRLMFLATVVFELVWATVYLKTSAAEDTQAHPTRLWKDATGKFQIRAVLVEQTDSAVRLHTDDRREINVPILRLSQEDQDYLKSLKAPADDPFAGDTPIPERTAATEESKSGVDALPLPEAGATIDLDASPVDAPFVPDPASTTVKFSSGVVPIDFTDVYDHVSVPVLASQADSTFFLSIGRNPSGSPEEARGRIYAVNLTKKDATLVWDTPEAVSVVGHDESSGRTLIIDKLDDSQSGGEFVILEGLAASNPKPLFRRALPGAGKSSSARKVEWAKLLSGSRIAAIINNVFYLWEVPAAKLIYRLEGVRNAFEPPDFSGNERYMVVPLVDGRVAVLETASGAVRKVITTGTRLPTGVAFHPDGRRIVICFSHQYLVWDCVADRVVNQATTPPILGSHSIDWIGPKMFRANSCVVHIDLGMVVWQYGISLSTDWHVAGGKLVTAATTVNQCSLVSVEYPDASVDRAVSELMDAGDDAMLIRPGSAVAIAVESTAGPVNEEEIKAAVTQVAEQAGWKVSNEAEVTLVAKIGRDDPQELQFISLRGGGISTATITPFTSGFEIRIGTDVLWDQPSINSVPEILHPEPGETVQQAVKRYEQPDIGYFTRLTLPPRIPKPEISAKVGLSFLRDGNWRRIK